MMTKHPSCHGWFAWHRTCSEAFVWDDGWLVFADQFSTLDASFAKHIAVQFRRRPRIEGSAHVSPFQIDLRRPLIMRALLAFGLVLALPAADADALVALRRLCAWFPGRGR